jgi:hypothetical protein
MSHDALACVVELPVRADLSAGPPPPCRRGTQYLAVLCLLYLRVTDTTRLLLIFIFFKRREAGRGRGGTWLMGYTSCSNTRRPRGDSGTLALGHFGHHTTHPHAASHTRTASGSATGGRKTSNRMLQACAVRCPARVSRPRPSRPRACHRGCRRSK